MTTTQGPRIDSRHTTGAQPPTTRFARKAALRGGALLRAVDGVRPEGGSLGLMELLGDSVAPGTRVRVVRDPHWNGPWPAEPAGTIGPPSPVRTLDLAAMPEVNIPDSDRGPMREFYVAFDEPQLDGDGHGPYRAAVVWEKYLRLAE